MYRRLERFNIAVFAGTIFACAISLMFILAALIVGFNIMIMANLYQNQTSQMLALALVVAALSVIALLKIFRSKWPLLDLQGCFDLTSGHLPHKSHT